MSLAKLRAQVAKQKLLKDPLRHALPLAGKGLDTSFNVVQNYIRANTSALALHEKLLVLLKDKEEEKEQDDESTTDTN